MNQATVKTIKKATKLEHPQYSALTIAKYLLSLDRKRNYFTLKWIDPKERWESIPREGSFRLNKMLHLCQMLYCAKYKKPLFWEKMLAFEHGAIVESVRIDYIKLHWTLGKQEIEMEKDDKNFVKKVFNRFCSESNDTLENLSHDDPAWKLGKEKINPQIMPLDERLINYYYDLLEDTLEEIGV